MGEYLSDYLREKIYKYRCIYNLVGYMTIREFMEIGENDEKTVAGLHYLLKRRISPTDADKLLLYRLIENKNSFPSNYFRIFSQETGTPFTSAHLYIAIRNRNFPAVSLIVDEYKKKLISLSDGNEGDGLPCNKPMIYRLIGESCSNHMLKLIMVNMFNNSTEDLHYVYEGVVGRKHPETDDIIGMLEYIHDLTPIKPSHATTSCAFKNGNVIYLEWFHKHWPMTSDMVEYLMSIESTASIDFALRKGIFTVDDLKRMINQSGNNMTRHDSTGSICKFYENHVPIFSYADVHMLICSFGVPVFKKYHDRIQHLTPFTNGDLIRILNDSGHDFNSSDYEITALPLDGIDQYIADPFLRNLLSYKLISRYACIVDGNNNNNNNNNNNDNNAAAVAAAAPNLIYSAENI